MAKTRFIQNGFSSGVLSPLIRARDDLQQYSQGLEIGDNVILIPQGGVKRRPGTEFIDKALPKLLVNSTVPSMPNGGTGSSINDSNDATNTTTTTNISTTNPYVVAKYDLGSSKYIDMADVRGIFLSAGTSSEFVIQSSDDDVTYTTNATITLIGANALNFRLFVGQTKRYWQLARVGASDLGTDKVTLSEFSLLELTLNSSEAKLKDFSVETNKHYLLVFTDFNIRVYEKDSNLHVADLKSQLSSSQVMGLKETQSESVMIVVHEDVKPQRLINLKTDIDWLIEDVPFSNIPDFDYNDKLSPTPTSEIQVATFSTLPLFVAGDTYQVDVEGVLSKEITFSGDTTSDERASTEANLQKNLQDMPSFGEGGVSVSRTNTLEYTITISNESADSFKLFSGFPTTGTASKTITFVKTQTGSPRKEPIWSFIRGYPKSVAFSSGRLVIGGTKSKPQSLIMSKAGSALNFDIGDGDDDQAIFVTVSSRKLNNIRDVFPAKNLQIFTDGAEFTVSDPPITPSSISINPQTSNGSINVEVKEIDGVSLFVDRNGNSINEFLFNFQEGAYISNNISVLSPEMINQPLDIAVLNGTSADAANWVFIINRDGSASILNKLRSQDINGYTKWKTSGSLTNVSVVDQELYMVNKRVINGVEESFIERWDFNHLMDSSIKTTQSGGEILGLDHLEGESVFIVSDGVVLPERTVVLGKVTLSLEEQAYTDYEVGLNFIPKIRPMPISTNIGSGRNISRLKRIVRTNIITFDTVGLSFDGEDVPVRSFGDNALGTPPTRSSGIISDLYNTVPWGRDVMPTITSETPSPMTILLIESEVESS